MDAKLLISVGTIYGAIYYYCARWLLSALRTVDLEYFNYLGAQGGVGPSNSYAIMKVVFDFDVPKVFWPKKIKLLLILVRTMLGLYPFVILAIFLLL